jgi:hypothetical protein
MNRKVSDNRFRPVLGLVSTLEHTRLVLVLGTFYSFHKSLVLVLGPFQTSYHPGIGIGSKTDFWLV